MIVLDEQLLGDGLEIEMAKMVSRRNKIYY